MYWHLFYNTKSDRVTRFSERYVSRDKGDASDIYTSRDAGTTPSLFTSGKTASVSYTTLRKNSNAPLDAIRSKCKRTTLEIVAELDRAYGKLSLKGIVCEYIINSRGELQLVAILGSYFRGGKPTWPMQTRRATKLAGLGGDDTAKVPRPMSSEQQLVMAVTDDVMQEHPRIQRPNTSNGAFARRAYKQGNSLGPKRPESASAALRVVNSKDSHPGFRAVPIPSQPGKYRLSKCLRCDQYVLVFTAYTRATHRTGSPRKIIRGKTDDVVAQMQDELNRLRNLVQIQYERSQTSESRIEEFEEKAKAAFARQQTAESTLADMSKTIAFERNESRETISALRSAVAEAQKKLELTTSQLQITEGNLHESEKKNKQEREMTFRIVKTEQDKIDELNAALINSKRRIEDLSADKKRLLESNKEKDQAILALEIQVRHLVLVDDIVIIMVMITTVSSSSS